jgi:hypothetical protein
MFRVVLCGLVLFTSLALQRGATAAENRVALVIGNSAYRHVP